MDLFISEMKSFRGTYSEILRRTAWLPLQLKAMRLSPRAALLFVLRALLVGLLVVSRWKTPLVEVVLPTVTRKQSFSRWSGRKKLVVSRRTASVVARATRFPVNVVIVSTTFSFVLLQVTRLTRAMEPSRTASIPTATPWKCLVRWPTLLRP